MQYGTHLDLALFSGFGVQDFGWRVPGCGWSFEVLAVWSLISLSNKWLPRWHMWTSWTKRKTPSSVSQPEASELGSDRNPLLQQVSLLLQSEGYIIHVLGFSSYLYGQSRTKHSLGTGGEANTLEESLGARFPSGFGLSGNATECRRLGSKRSQAQRIMVTCSCCSEQA